jgi:predicted transcriptional regulator
MKLTSYLEIIKKHGATAAGFARRAQIAQTTFNQIVLGAGCNALNAQKIIIASGGLVTLEDLAKQTPSKPEVGRKQ